MLARKGIIGIVGGIGSGKSFVAGLFGELGCAVISSDEQVKQAYRDPAVLGRLREWWGGSVFRADGSPDRRAIAERVFNDPAARLRLENLIHPRVAELRRRKMAELAGDPAVVAFVWDTPLLFEAGLNRQCDAIVFVDAPRDLRLERVAGGRGWAPGELQRRENLQWPLDRKRKLSDYVVENTAGTADARRQVRDVLSRILAHRR